MVPARRCLLLVALLSQGVLADDGRPKRNPPRFTNAKETTYFVGPLDKEGYVDYAAALNEHFGRGVTPENNANVLYWLATGPMSESAGVPRELFKLLGMDPPPDKGLYHADLGTYLVKQLKIDFSDPRYTAISEAFRDHALVEPWSEALFPHVGSWLTFNAAPLDTVLAGTRQQASYAPLFHPKDPDTPTFLTQTILFGVSTRRDFGRAFTARALLHLGEGRPHAAWEDLQACHRLAAHVACGPWTIDSLVGVSIDGMASAGDLTFLKHARLSAEQAARCLEELQALPPLPPIAEKITVTERVVFLDCIQSLARHGQPALDALWTEFQEESPPEWVPKVDLSQVDWDEAFKVGNTWFDRYVEALGGKDVTKTLKAVAELDGKFVAFAAEVRSGPPPPLPAGDALGRQKIGQRLGGYLFVLFHSAFPAVLNADARGLQARHNAQVAFALAAHRAANGSYPAKLADLSPRYLKQVPPDVFTGRELVYSAAADSYVLYSVGPNGKDEGGAGYRDVPAGDDLMVRMPF